MDDDKRNILEHLYINAVINEETEKLPMPCKIKKTAYENYEQVLILLAKLKGKGKCDFTYDSIFEPYVMHCINVQWKADEDGYLELDAREIATVLGKMDGIVIDTQSEMEWQLSTTIYFRS